ncbi:gamma-type small acid-soluble spore protein [Peribacillus psychrosaccharolyticus]|uniref:Small, acid-soluble spore protein gamma-type n=1 Tax=Peribacillus psychrosaccharolyticus TaxID=1407 RepID=A0A974NNG0_PERPY|nr:gamma-type small acid-soluble spore protein [Peribacillus psychrosaccharolyticus]MEC2055914.1 gamma-type small acid-soluble spore protein [Peribacillus psychrosaccharolyticus]MED3743089.1 gamma-type small acid-soluble spore protein [Peribacillus psychrosaccharolyticus]QQT00869.1 gamma-type small acid-soluble spore protein [Peribacillus psychrosaccharolyticus]
MRENDKQTEDTFTVAGTNIDAVKRQNERSGMSYKEVQELLARTTGGRGTAIYSDTNIEKVKEQNQQSTD